MNLKDVKSLLEVGLIKKVFSGRVRNDEEFSETVEFGNIPDCECGWDEMKEWEDVECFSDNTIILDLTCYDRDSNPLYYMSEYGFFYSERTQERIKRKGK